ncbi:HPr(Ser) kinase/phosphatase [Thermoactinomyces sp. DSM 45892]|uniref:HPr(Ser) kinase/phosphatase n=1 Tax=Thermoactinomyces sp. DSM 45892 TaxID=1882753 RepID=UPI000896DD7D|nr:HPr(Ser) kinase/phosphatase [Thermoactinomyces sp. DSM 45892]SDZ33961.1 Hpr(Ser) kinase/phosphatase [Thermoactinomyces sp. DSM 45892]
MLKTVSVRKLQQHFQLEIVCGEEQLDRNITVSDLYRPGLELSGFFTYHPIERLQILGKTELTFIESLPPDVRKQRIERFCHPFLPCICVTRNMEIPEELIHIAKRHRVPLLRTVLATTRFSSKVTNYLEKVLAPTTTVHGVLVDIYGEGVLIMGDSGIGKSETALELVKRGHRLVADDAVEIKQAEENMLIGSAPELIRHLLEIRGLGIINVMTLFGAGAVRNKKRLSFVIQLETWQANRQYDRLGLDEERMKIIDTNVPLLTVPVRPGRNLAVIIEVAAMNMRLRQMGYDAAQQFVQKLGETIDDQDPDVDDYD